LTPTWSVRLPGAILAHPWRRLSGPDAFGFVVEWRGEPVEQIMVSFATAVRLINHGDAICPHMLHHSANRLLT